MIALCILSASSVELRVDGHWGGWTGRITVPPDYYLCGMQMRFEPYQGRSDDTATNGFKFFFCNSIDWSVQVTKQFDGIWGEWKSAVLCSEGFYVNGFAARIESPCGSCDDTSFNGLQIQCARPFSDEKEVKMVYEGGWGAWTGWKFAPINEFIDSYNIRN